MSAQAFVIVLFVGAFSLAVWVDVRWPELAPKELARAMLHVAAAVILSRPVISIGLTIGQRSPTFMLLAVVTFVLPALMYCVMAAIWVVKVVSETMVRYRL
jgi:hypothetical protein